MICSTDIRITSMMLQSWRSDRGDGLKKMKSSRKSRREVKIMQTSPAPDLLALYAELANTLCRVRSRKPPEFKCSVLITTGNVLAILLTKLTMSVVISKYENKETKPKMLPLGK